MVWCGAVGERPGHGCREPAGSEETGPITPEREAGRQADEEVARVRAGSHRLSLSLTLYLSVCVCVSGSGSWPGK